MKIIYYAGLLSLTIAAGCSEKQIYESEEINASAATVAIPISSPQYQKYTGTYQMQQASFAEVVITSENGKLYAQATDEKKVEIFPEKGHTFSVPAFKATLSFIQADDSTFSGISILLEGNMLKGIRKK